MGRLADHVLALHGWAALAVIFALPALESSVFVGFIFPGEIAVLLGGVLAFQHRVSLPGAIAAAVAGAVIGDSVGYEVGRRWGRRLLEGTVGRFVDHGHFDRAQRYLATRGGRAVFFGRFTAALRVLIPGMAGMAGMEYRTFAAYNVAGGSLWATGFVLAGYAAGNGWRHVEHVAKRASLVLAVVVVAALAISLAARWAARHQGAVRGWSARQLERPTVVGLCGRFRRQLDFLGRRVRPEGALGLSLTASLAVLVAVGWLFGTVVQDVLAGDDSARLDRPTLELFARHREPWLTTAMKLLTSLGSSAVLVPALVVAGLVCWRVWGRSWRPLGVLAVSYGGAVILWNAVKVLTDRARPPAALAVTRFDGLAFPSGHATQAMVAWGAGAALIAARTSSWARKVAAWAVAGVVVVVVGITRLYLGAHWLTDVIGGGALGAMWLTIILAMVRIVPARPPTSGGDAPATEGTEPPAKPVG